MSELKLPFFGHGGDYNPDQWRHIPGTLEEDIRLMKKAGCNLMSVGIFSWAALEPDEGKFDFDWLEDVLDKFAQNGIYAFLATPSGARPAWMSQKYPEVLRVREDGGRNLHGFRHNHCFTSPLYRFFVARINEKLAERFGAHPAVVGWHISNEYNGECHCELCQQAFRDFLKEEYGTLEKLNQAWWTGFWAKTYTDWNQLHSPTPIGEMAIQGLEIAWRRFVTRQTIDFMRAEIAPLKKIAPKLPVTHNLHGDFPLDYYRFADDLDFASYDCYPRWGCAPDDEIASGAGFWYDATRGVKHQSWVLMESTPSMTNWQPVCRPKKPGMHFLSSVQAIAHGADTVQYFQWRKSRGAAEQFHGAVVDHCGHENTRVFREVAELGEQLKKLSPLVGANNPADTLLIFDWDNRNALNCAMGPRRDKQYMETLAEHYRALKRQGANVDVSDSLTDFSKYKLIVAPMLFMVKPGVAERLEQFVEGGGILVTTYWSGIVDKDGLCFLGGFPGPLRKLTGVWSEEIDALPDGEQNSLVAENGEKAPCGFLCDLLHTETAEPIYTYGEDFYKGMPAVTVNKFGAGYAYYLGARAGVDFLKDFYKMLYDIAKIRPIVNVLPEGVEICERANETGRYLFVLNFTGGEADVCLPDAENALTGQAVGGDTHLDECAVLILKLK